MLQDRLVAHRGYPAQYPENTLLSFRKAIEAGAHFIETDIQFTADLQPVLYHDMLTERISGVENAIHLMQLSAVKELPANEPQRLGRAFAGETVASLQDLVTLLQAHPEVAVFVELKRTAAHFAGVEQAFDILNRILAPIRERAILISFAEDFIRHARDKGYPRLGTVLTEWSQKDAPDVARAEFVFCDIAKIPADADLSGFAGNLVVYEVADPALAEDLFRRGADMIETFDIDGMLSTLARHAL